MKSQNKTTIYWSLLNYKYWNMYIAATSKGLCFVGSQNMPFEELSVWAEKRFPGSPLVEDREKLQPYAIELIEYLEGKRKSFTIPFDYKGTEFQLAVWNALCEIPYGQTKSYADIANHIQKPTAVRAVGTAIGANPVLITVPCHRVIGKNGSLTGYRGGLEMKTKLLDLERHHEKDDLLFNINSKDEGVYGNEANEDADVILTVNTEMGVGEVTFKLDK